MSKNKIAAYEQQQKRNLSPREVELSNQRMEAIDRAERAESVSFDAMAEMSQAQGERDDLLAKVGELEQTMEKLRVELERCKSSNASET